MLVYSFKRFRKENCKFSGRSIWTKLQIFSPSSICICFFRDADDAVHDMDGKDMDGGRVRVELARPPGNRDRDRDRRGGGGGFGRGRSPPRGRGGRPPGPKTDYRIVVENLSSRTSWQVRKEIKDLNTNSGFFSADFRLTQRDLKDFFLN